MSALALLTLNQNKVVLGSDLNKNNITKKLSKNGIKVFKNHKGKNIKGCDLIVFSGAISQNNPEIIEAKNKNIDIVERSEFLQMIASKYSKVIAISGSHGKTTTTALISYIFILCGLDPTVHIGGEYGFIDGNLRIGSNEYFITEACEFRDSFLSLRPDISVITNIEPEHLDYFKNFKNEKSSFSKFCKNTNDKCFVTEKFVKYLKDANNIISTNIGSKGNITARNIKKSKDNKYIFDCYVNNDFLGNFKLNIFGKHNIENALLAIAVCLEFNISYEVIKLGLKTFKNVDRRFDILGNYKNCLVVHDYAHHPTEICKTIKTCKQVFKKKVICVFQPHTYSRTKLLINSFVKCFDGLDVLYLLKTYSAREKFEFLGSANYLKDCILKENTNFCVKGAYSKNDFIKLIKKEELSNCVLLFLGAGDIYKLLEKLIKRNKN